MKRPQVIVTTSWDDGHKLDTRLAELLKKYHIKATLYVSPHDQEFAAADRLTSTEIKALSRDFEIGAHTMTHPRLPKVSDETARQEIVKSKRYLERLIGRPVTAFCYPGGNYQPRHVTMVREAGFRYARSVRRHRYNLKGSLLEAATTVNAYNHYQDLWKIARFARFNPWRTLYYFRWDKLAKAMFDKVMAEGGVFHLWGHSWEIDKHHDWERLEEVLCYIADKSGVRYVTNGELPALQPKRLLIVPPYYPPHLGGVEYYAFHIANQLRRVHGWDVVVATSGQRGGPIIKTQAAGITVYRLPYWFKLSNSPLNPLWLLWLGRIMKREDIYIVDIQAPVPGLPDLAAAVAAQLHLPLVATYHMTSMAKGRSGVDWLIALYEQRVLPRMLGAARYVICSSDKVRDEFLLAFRHKSVTISPGIDTAAFRPAASLAKHTLLYVGSLNKTDNHKGVVYLLEAMRSVIAEEPQAHLLLVGPGSGITYFEGLAREYGVSAHVSFLGGMYNEQLQRIYRRASLFVLPTLNDSFPLVILEAMASGLPVVSTPVGAIPSMVDAGRSGYLVPPADAQALAERLIYLLRHPATARRLGARGRSKVAETLTWQMQAAKTHPILMAALGDVDQGVTA